MTRPSSLPDVRSPRGEKAGGVGGGVGSAVLFGYRAESPFEKLVYYDSDTGAAWTQSHHPRDDHLTAARIESFTSPRNRAVEQGDPSADSPLPVTSVSWSSPISSGPLSSSGFSSEAGRRQPDDNWRPSPVTVSRPLASPISYGDSPFRSSFEFSEDSDNASGSQSDNASGSESTCSTAATTGAEDQPSSSTADSCVDTSALAADVCRRALRAVRHDLKLVIALSLPPPPPPPTTPPPEGIPWRRPLGGVVGPTLLRSELPGGGGVKKKDSGPYRPYRAGGDRDCVPSAYVLQLQLQKALLKNENLKTRLARAVAEAAEANTSGDRECVGLRNELDELREAAELHVSALRDNFPAEAREGDAGDEGDGHGCRSAETTEGLCAELRRLTGIVEEVGGRREQMAMDAKIQLNRLALTKFQVTRERSRWRKDREKLCEEIRSLRDDNCALILRIIERLPGGDPGAVGDEGEVVPASLITNLEDFDSTLIRSWQSRYSLGESSASSSLTLNSLVRYPAPPPTLNFVDAAATATDASIASERGRAVAQPNARGADADIHAESYRDGGGLDCTLAPPGVDQNLLVVDGPVLTVDSGSAPPEESLSTEENDSEWTPFDRLSDNTALAKTPTTSGGAGRSFLGAPPPEEAGRDDVGGCVPKGIVGGPELPVAVDEKPSVEDRGPRTGDDLDGAEDVVPSPLGNSDSVPPFWYYSTDDEGEAEEGEAKHVAGLEAEMPGSAGEGEGPPQLDAVSPRRRGFCFGMKLPRAKNRRLPWRKAKEGSRGGPIARASEVHVQRMTPPVRVEEEEVIPAALDRDDVPVSIDESTGMIRPVKCVSLYPALDDYSEVTFSHKSLDASGGISNSALSVAKDNKSDEGGGLVDTDDQFPRDEATTRETITGGPEKDKCTNPFDQMNESDILEVDELKRLNPFEQVISTNVAERTRTRDGYGRSLFSEDINDATLMPMEEFIRSWREKEHSSGLGNAHQKTEEENPKNGSESNSFSSSVASKKLICDQILIRRKLLENQVVRLKMERALADSQQDSAAHHSQDIWEKRANRKNISNTQLETTPRSPWRRVERSWSPHQRSRHLENTRLGRSMPGSPCSDISRAKSPRHAASLPCSPKEGNGNLPFVPPPIFTCLT